MSFLLFFPNISNVKVITSNSKSNDDCDSTDRWIVARSINEAVNILTDSGLQSNDYQLIPGDIYILKSSLFFRNFMINLFSVFV